MKKMTLLILTLISIFACDNEESTPAPSNSDFLTSGSQKSWYIFSGTPGSPCGSASDSWTFFANGTFTYNHGTITDDATNPCGDLVNLEGTWQFSSDETTITVIALREAGSNTNNLSLTLMEDKITTLDNDRLVVNSTGSNNIQYTTEFRKK
jgi:hypothetical protein